MFHAFIWLPEKNKKNFWKKKKEIVGPYCSKCWNWEFWTYFFTEINVFVITRSKVPKKGTVGYRYWFKCERYPTLSRMDNFDETDEPAISSSGQKRKIKAEMFSRSLAKAERYNGEGKAPGIACNHNHTVYDHNHNNICQASTLSSEEITKMIKQVFFFF